jgi:hypothetical protein
MRMNQCHQCVMIKQVQIRLRSMIHERSMPLAHNEYTAQNQHQHKGIVIVIRQLDGYFRRPCSLDASPVDAF